MKSMLPTAQSKEDKWPMGRPLKAYAIVVLLWFFFQALWYAYLGVHFELEAGKYIEEAQNLLQYHRFSATRFLFYSTTIVVIAVSFVTKIGLYGALVMIMLINLCSYLFFFRALRSVFDDRLSPYLVVVAMLSFWPYQAWSLFLYTECLFYSLVVFLFAHLLRYRQLTMTYAAMTVFLLLLTILSRPLGILFVPPVLLFFFWQMTKKHRLYFVAVVILAALALNYIVQIVFTTTSDWNMQRAVAEGDIICDIPGKPANQLDLSNDSNQLYRLFYYVTHNFPHFFGLALTRLRYFFTLVRPYYSPFHNAYVVAYLVVWYGCFLLGFRRIYKRFPLPVLTFMLSSILLFALAIALQCDDYHNRFFLTLTPFFSVMAVAVLSSFISRLSFFSAPRKG